MSISGTVFVQPASSSLYTSLHPHFPNTSGGLGALQARFHQPISGSDAEAGAEGYEEESTEGLQPRPGAGSQGGKTQREEELHHPGSTQW